MRESTFTFGPAELVGILSEPSPDEVVRGAPAVVFLNSGILHRPGASRMYVRTARALAEDGFTCLRFDFSGIGDSPVRRDDMPIERRFVIETREAMDYLQEALGTERFVLGGLCSGADAAFWAALEDDRVVGVWQIDGFCYPTFGHMRRRFAPKLFSPSAWINAFRHRVFPSRNDTRAADEEVFVKPEYRRVFPPRSQVSNGLEDLLDRGTRLYFFFTGGLEEYSYAEQHGHAFSSIRLGERATIRHVGECSHTITGLDHQDILVADLRSWMKAFSPAETAPV